MFVLRYNSSYVKEIALSLRMKAVLQNALFDAERSSDSISRLNSSIQTTVNHHFNNEKFWWSPRLVTCSQSCLSKASESVLRLSIPEKNNREKLSQTTISSAFIFICTNSSAPEWRRQPLFGFQYDLFFGDFESKCLTLLKAQIRAFKHVSGYSHPTMKRFRNCHSCVSLKGKGVAH